MDLLIPPSLAVLSACLYGITMKVADLLNEHGLRWFRGSPLIFGIFWGLFGALLVLTDNTVANLMVAMNLAFVIRNRLDYLNHQLASSLIILTFLFSATLEPAVFLVFYGFFLLGGSLKDYVDDTLQVKEGWFKKLNEAMLYYPLPTLAYCLLYGNWLLFYVFTLYTGYYDFTKYFAGEQGYH